MRYRRCQSRWRRSRRGLSYGTDAPFVLRLLPQQHKDPVLVKSGQLGSSGLEHVNDVAVPLVLPRCPLDDCDRFLWGNPYLIETLTPFGIQA